MTQGWTRHKAPLKCRAV